MIFKAIVCILATLVITSCQSVYTVENINRPVQTIRAAVKEVLPGGLRRVSENGREHDSYYFPTKGSFDADGSTLSPRSYAHMVILGAGRPYGVSIEIFVEKKQGTTYQKVGLDLKRAQELGKKLKTALANRRDERNVIDEFKPF